MADVERLDRAINEHKRTNLLLKSERASESGSGILALVRVRASRVRRADHVYLSFLIR